MMYPTAYIGVHTIYFSLETLLPKDATSGASAYAMLVNEIKSGALAPGDRLVETDLAQRLGISRTPVREAIRVLESEGLVAHVPRVGLSVRTLDYSEVMELYAMRAVLEGTAARMAAQAASDIELAELEDINAELKAASADGARSYELNRQFHLALLDGAKNRFLTKSMIVVQKTLLILGPSTLAETARAQKAVDEHADILRALRARDADAAEAAMRSHIEASQRKRLKLLRDRRDLEAVAFGDGDA